MTPLGIRPFCEMCKRLAVCLLLCWFVFGNCPPVGGQADHVNQLVGQLKKRDPDLRESAAKALGETKDARAVEPLIAMLKDKTFDVRAAAAKALGQIGDPRAADPLVAALADVDLRDEAAIALVRCKDPRGVVPLIDVLRSSERREEAVEAFGSIGAPAVMNLVAGLGDTNNNVVSGAFQALIRSDRPPLSP